MSEARSNPFRFVPSIDWLRRYPKAWLRLDVIAGLTAAAVVIPKALAILVGAMLALATVLRFVANFILEPVLTGSNQVAHGGRGEPASPRCRTMAAGAQSRGA